MGGGPAYRRRGSPGGGFVCRLPIPEDSRELQSSATSVSKFGTLKCTLYWQLIPSDSRTPRLELFAPTVIVFTARKLCQKSIIGNDSYRFDYL